MKTDIIIPNNEPYIITRNNEQGTCLFIDIEMSGVTFVVKKMPKNTLPHSRKTMHAEFKNKSDTISNMEN
jgi:hypothetical protein